MCNKSEEHSAIYLWTLIKKQKESENVTEQEHFTLEAGIVIKPQFVLTSAISFSRDLCRDSEWNALCDMQYCVRDFSHIS